MKRFLFALFIMMSAGLQAQIVNIEDRRTAFTDSIGWYEDLSLGFNIVKNTSKIFSVNGSFQLEVLQKNRMLLSITKFNFLDAGETSFINDGFQHIRYNQIIEPWFTYELFGQLQFNEKLAIKIRGLAGTGFRFRFFNRPKRKMYLGITYMYEYDEESQNEITHRHHRMSSYLSFSIKVGDRARIASTSYFQPLWSNFNDYRFSSQNSFVVEIFKNLSFGSTFNFSHDSRASEGAPTDTYSLSNFLRYKL